MADDRLNILLVEDDEIDVMNVKRAFKDNDWVHPLHVAENGADALDKLRSGQVSRERLLVLLDVNMPRMNGIEFLRELRADPQLKSIAVVVLSTSDDERDKVEAHKLHVAGYILKPVTFSSFLDCMKTIRQYWSMVEFP